MRSELKKQTQSFKNKKTGNQANSNQGNRAVLLRPGKCSHPPACAEEQYLALNHITEIL